jgi:hypothetical protein
MNIEDMQCLHLEDPFMLTGSPTVQLQRAYKKSISVESNGSETFVP